MGSHHRNILIKTEIVITRNNCVELLNIGPLCTNH